MKKIAIGSDHAGYGLKTYLVKYLESTGYEVIDFGTHSEERADYPDFAHKVASSVAKNSNSFGILICGSGNGVCMTANKHNGIRAGLVWEKEIAELILVGSYKGFSKAYIGSSRERLPSIKAQFGKE